MFLMALYYKNRCIDGVSNKIKNVNGFWLKVNRPEHIKYIK